MGRGGNVQRADKQIAGEQAAAGRGTALRKSGARETLGARVYRDLAGLLISGTLSPGDKVSLRTMAQRLGVSMQPVRQAVDRLVADQALEVLPNRAVRVPVISAGQFRELTAIRIVIEGLAVEKAAQCRSTKDIRALNTLNREFQGVSRGAGLDPLKAVRVNLELHFCAYRASGMPGLVAIIEGLWLRIGPVLNLDMRESPERLLRGTAGGYHTQMVEAIAAGNGRAARAALKGDIATAARFILGRGVLPDVKP